MDVLADAGRILTAVLRMIEKAGRTSSHLFFFFLVANS